MAEIETRIFHSLFADGLIKNGYSGVKISTPDKVGTLDVKFDESDCEAFMSGYDQENCVNPNALIEYIKKTQIENYNELVSSCGSETDEIIKKSVIKEIEDRGMLYVLQNGFDIKGLPFFMHFEAFAKKPSDYALGEAEKRDYAANDFACIHEFKYCELNNERIDFAIFVNGLPLFDVELKTKLAGSHYNYVDAITQYEDRVKSSKRAEAYHKYWSNKTGMLVHFAVDDNNAYICTNVKEKHSRFRPFNMGQGEGISKRSGNPIAASGFSVEYLYKNFVPAGEIRKDFIDNIFAKDMVADIVHNYTQYEDGNLVFPRYHQLNAVTRLEKDIKEFIRDKEESGKNYLIQHSAGSGKTKSITWLAYKLQALKKPDGTSLFGSVIILTDRRVVIGQLGDSVWGSEKREDDMIARVDQADNKSDALRDALRSEKRIITCTIQSFLDLKDKMDFDINKRYLVIIDESHSSTDGKDIEAVKSSLESEDGSVNISLVGFTATPKKATLMTFGTYYRTIVDAKGNNVDEYLPFDVYSMRQAIEEEYILDVFKAYKTLEAHCELALISADKEVQKNYAKGILAGMKEDKGLNIPNKVDFIIKDFYEGFIKNSVIDGKEKAMILANSKEEAVAYYNTLIAALPDCGIPEMESIGVLIAFSGKDASDKEENDYNKLAPIPKTDIIKNTFNQDEYKILIVVDKYQTGYDQPKLCVMYVDKELESDVQIVQTLSRLNRPYYTENDVLKPISIIDFRNDFDSIKTAFETFYETTYLERKQVTVADLDVIMQRLFDRNVLSDKMLDEIKKGIFAEISIVGQQLELDKKSDDKSVVERANKKIADIYNYTRLYGMLMEDSEERKNIVGNDYMYAYLSLERIKNFISSLLRPKGKNKENIKGDVGQFITGQKIDKHEDDKQLVAHGKVSQGYRERRIVEDNDKEQLSILIKEMNGIDGDSLSKLVDVLAQHGKLKSIALNSTNTRSDFNREFKAIFLVPLQELLDKGEIDFAKFTEFYRGADQIAGLVYDKIKNINK